MQAIEGYVENGRFFTAGNALQMPERRRAFITILDEPPHDVMTTERISAIDEFFSAIESSDERIPEFERVKFSREVEL